MAVVMKDNLKVNGFVMKARSTHLFSTLARKKLNAFQWDTAKTAAYDRMQKSVDAVQASFATVQARSVNPAILDRILVRNSVGGSTSLNELARVSTPLPGTIIIEPYEKSSNILRSIEKAITDADRSFSCVIDSNERVKVTIPSLTKDRREQLIKQVGTISEDGKVSVRNVRRDVVEVIKKAEKSKEVSKDGSRNYQDVIQKAHDAHIKKIEDLWKMKQKSLDQL